MIRFFKVFLSFYISLFPALANGVYFVPHHHHEHDYHHNEHFHVHCEEEHGVRGVVGAGVSDIAGEDHPWRNLLRTTAANVVGQWGAGQIGQAHMDTSSIFNNPMVHKLAHGVVGALSGALMGGRGCTASGALGAMIGETLGCMMLDEPLAAQEHAVGGRILTKAEYEALNQKAFDHYKQHIADVAKMAKIMTVMSSALTGFNVEVANQTATNAIDHNFVHVAAFGGLVCVAGFGAYVLKYLAPNVFAGLSPAQQAAVVNNSLDALNITQEGGAYKLGDKVFDTLKGVLTHIANQAGLHMDIAKALLGLNVPDIYQEESVDATPQAPRALPGEQPSSATSGGAMPPPEDPEENTGQKEKRSGKYKRKELSPENKKLIKNKKLEGENIIKVKPENDGTVRVHTEKQGGLEEAKKIFEKLTGEKIPDGAGVDKPYEKILPGGKKEVRFRNMGNSGHPKIEVTDHLQKLLEKVTFK